MRQPALAGGLQAERFGDHISSTGRSSQLDLPAFSGAHLQLGLFPLEGRAWSQRGCCESCVGQKRALEMDSEDSAALRQLPLLPFLGSVTTACLCSGASSLWWPWAM